MSLLKKAFNGIGGFSGLGGLIGGVAGGFAGDPVAGAEIGSSIGGMLGPSEDRLQRREDLYWYRKQNKDIIKFWQMQNEYNSPAAQAQRYLAAGMNPYLAQGTVGDPGNAGTISVASTPHHTINSGSRGDRSMVKFFQNKQMESAENQNEAEMLRNEYYKLKNIQLADKIERDRKRGGAVLANKVRADKPLTQAEAIKRYHFMRELLGDEVSGGNQFNGGFYLGRWIGNLMPKTDYLSYEKPSTWKQFFNTSGRRFNPRGI